MSENTVHDVILECRRKAAMTGISDVESFDEETVVAQSDCGLITVHGHNLKISRLSVESGDMVVEGEIDSVIYSGDRTKVGFLSRVFR